MENTVVLGAGSWGSALSLVLANNGHNVKLWEYNKDVAKELTESRENKRLLPGVKFPSNITITNETQGILKDAKYIIFSIPSQALRSVVKRFADQFTEDMIIINTGKGMEISTSLRLSDVIKSEISPNFHKNVVVLSGPTHAEEVAKGSPTSIVAAGLKEKARKVQDLFNCNFFRVYLNEDVVGVEIGAAIKNCLAIAAGIVDGVGYGDNTKVALITRGLAEMIRYGKYKGANELTFSGLSGIGDLIVTSISKHSRNRHVGEALGKGETITEILDKMTMVAEGVPTVKVIYGEIKNSELSMPIIEAVYKIINEELDPKVMIVNLMGRAAKDEFY